MVRTPDSARHFGPFTHNGYEAEWLHLADLATGAAAPRYTPAELVADLAYATDLAARAGAVLQEEGVAA